MASSRLGIPISFTQETLHNGGPSATVFPMPLTMGTTWDEALVEEIYTSVARQARALGVDLGYGPVINLLVDPRFGRIKRDSAQTQCSLHAMPRPLSMGSKGLMQGRRGTWPQTASRLLAYIAVGASHTRVRMSLR